MVEQVSSSPRDGTLATYSLKPPASWASGGSASQGACAWFRGCQRARLDLDRAQAVQALSSESAEVCVQDGRQDLL